MFLPSHTICNLIRNLTAMVPRLSNRPNVFQDCRWEFSVPWSPHPFDFPLWNWGIKSLIYFVPPKFCYSMLGVLFTYLHQVNPFNLKTMFFCSGFFFFYINSFIVLFLLFYLFTFSGTAMSYLIGIFDFFFSQSIIFFFLIFFIFYSSTVYSSCSSIVYFIL